MKGLVEPGSRANIFKVWSFVHSKYVQYTMSAICFSFVPQNSLPRPCPYTPTSAFPDSLGYSAWMKIPGAAADPQHNARTEN